MFQIEQHSIGEVVFRGLYGLAIVQIYAMYQEKNHKMKAPHMLTI